LFAPLDHFRFSKWLDGNDLELRLRLCNLALPLLISLPEGEPMRFELERRQALMELMETTDEFDKLRTHRVTFEGDPDRFATLIPHVTSAFVQGRLLELEHRNEQIC
jgi:hypothetical protein